MTLPNSNGMQMLLCYDNEGVYVNTSGKVSCTVRPSYLPLKLIILPRGFGKQMLKNVVLQWGEMPTSVAFIGIGEIMGWGNKAIEIRNVETGHLDGVFMHKKAQRLKFLCERNDKVWIISTSPITLILMYLNFTICILGVFLVSQRGLDLADLFHGSQQARNGELVEEAIEQKNTINNRYPNSRFKLQASENSVSRTSST